MLLILFPISEAVHEQQTSTTGTRSRDKSFCYSYWQEAPLLGGDAQAWRTQKKSRKSPTAAHLCIRCG